MSQEKEKNFNLFYFRSENCFKSLPHIYTSLLLYNVIRLLLLLVIFFFTSITFFFSIIIYAIKSMLQKKN